ncbi:MAG TPA: hypothetical protein VN698_12470 [Bacteroidia bacterium]|nr:hypothetical protein [Bacteroidia bacterium]
MKKQLLVALSLLTVTSLLGQQARLANPLLKSATTKNGMPNIRSKHSLGQKRTNHPNSTNSVVSFSEDFDGIPGPTAGGAGTYSFPSGWFLSNVDNNTPASSFSYENEAWEEEKILQIT